MRLPTFLFVLLLGFAYLAHLEGWLDGTPLAIAPALTADLDEFSTGVREETLGSRFPDVDWKCHEERSDLGARVCRGRLRSWNGHYVRRAEFFFGQRGELRVVRIAYRPFAQEDMLNALRVRYGADKPVTRADRFGQPLVSWNLSSGVLLATSEVQPQFEGSVMWVSRESVVTELFKQWFDTMLEHMSN